MKEALSPLSPASMVGDNQETVRFLENKTQPRQVFNLMSQTNRNKLFKLQKSHR